jgi:glutathione S-transferase
MTEETDNVTLRTARGRNAQRADRGQKTRPTTCRFRSRASSWYSMLKNGIKASSALHRSRVMPELQIIGAPQSNYVWVTRIACAEKGAPYTLVAAMPHSPEIDAIHPFGKIPALRHGGVSLCESRAICFYVDHAFEGPPLVPADPAAGAATEQWISIVNTHIDPIAVRQYLGGYFFPGTADGSPDRARIDAALPKMEAQLAVLDRAVAGTGYLVGTSFTLSDMNLVPILFYLDKAPESGAMLRRLTSLKAYFDRHIERKSVKDTIPPPMPGRRSYGPTDNGSSRRVLEC